MTSTINASSNLMATAVNNDSFPPLDENVKFAYRNHGFVFQVAWFNPFSSALQNPSGFPDFFLNVSTNIIALLSLKKEAKMSFRQILIK